MQRFFVMQKRNSMKINNVCCSPENRRNGKRLNMHAVSCCQPNPMARFLRHAANLKNLKHPANPASHECTGISILSDVARKKKKRSPLHTCTSTDNLNFCPQALPPSNSSRPPPGLRSSLHFRSPSRFIDDKICSIELISVIHTRYDYLLPAPRVP